MLPALPAMCPTNVCCCNYSNKFHSNNSNNIYSFIDCAQISYLITIHKHYV